MKKIKYILNYIFVDGLSGMALGLFASLIIGTIIEQIGGFIDNQIGTYLIFVAAVAKSWYHYSNHWNLPLSFTMDCY